MQVRIVSLFALMDPQDRKRIWEGEVPVEFPQSKDCSDELEDIFRIFNRVDDEDVVQLAKMGYSLPSLSVGDLVTLVPKDRQQHARMFRVEGLGFKEVFPGLAG